MKTRAKSEMSYLRSEISSSDDKCHTCFSLPDFFHEAVQLLCGTMITEKSFTEFFAFLRRHIPVETFMLGRTLLDCQMVEIIAQCHESGTHLLARRMPHSDIQLEITGGRFHPLLRKGDSPLGAYFQDNEHPLVRYLKGCEEPLPLPVDAPLFFMRMHQAGKRFGGATFTCMPGQSFLPRHLELLRSLRTPLFAALNTWSQFHELKELKEQIWQENLRLKQELKGGAAVEVVGEGNGLRKTMDKVKLAGPVDVPVLITGETGTGKEVIARAVHDFSARKSRPFVAVNCGGIPSSLIDSELFGHVKGAFTGATNDHKGRFERAHGGTIFLDEIGELPMDVQARLLRVLQERSIERVGASSSIPVDFRLIAATNRDLREMVRSGQFREDLYYRLHVVPIHLPPLRERRQDIPLLVDHFLRMNAMKFGMLPPHIAPGEMNRLMDYSWPGNVRELQNVIEESLVLNPEGPLRFWAEDDYRHIPLLAEETAPPPPYEECLRQYFGRLLRHCNNKIGGAGGAAQIAGLNANTLRSKLDKLGINAHHRA